MRKSKQKTINSFHWQQKKRLQTPKQAAGGQPAAAEAVEEAENGRSRGGGKFFGCYLLTSLSPRYKGHTYIGFTVNPKRRIRQHNGEITSGASHTRMKRPWEMVFCIHGFPTNVAALQFEWAWQHPMESVNVREAAATFKSRGGLANKIKLALTMLTLHSWKSMDLRVSFFSTKYMKHTVGCPTLPQQMKLHFCPMDELPCYWDADNPPNGYSHDEDDLNDPRHSEEDVGELGEESHLSSINGFVEMNHSSSIGNAAIEEHVPPFRQVLPDIHGSILDKHSDPLRRYFPLDEESPSFPILEEHVRDVINTNEELQLNNEVRTEVLQDSVLAQEEHIETIQRVDPFEAESSSMVDAFEGTTKEQRQQIVEQPLSSRVADTTLRPFSTEGIEVIDLFTPSPDVRIIEGSKKRRVHDSSDIIDLTRYKNSTQQNESQNGSLSPSGIKDCS